MGRSIAAVAAMALMLGACSTGPDGADAVRIVQVDATTDEFPAFALRFFPDVVRVHPGDTVEFRQIFSGEPHSVTMGTLVDDTVPQLRDLADDAEPPTDVLAEFETLPVMLPEGPGDANQAAVNPCFIEAGGFPEDPAEPCAVTDQPVFTGTQAYFSSGYLPPSEDFVVELSDDIEPGGYTFYCNLHGPDMSGEIQVVDADEPIPSQAEVDAEARELVSARFLSIREAYDDVVNNRTPYATVAGFGVPGTHDVGIDAFLPDIVSIRAGEEVTWNVFGFHTITFNPPDGLSYFLAEADDGTWHIDERAFAPSGLEGAFDGSGFVSSGLITPGEGDEPPTFSLAFTEPGDYRYVCLIHPPMVGVVEVTP